MKKNTPLRLLVLLSWITVFGLFSSSSLVGAQAVGGGKIITPQGEFNSLQEALDAAQEGDTILVQGGTYAGPLVVDKPVKLIGENRPVVDGGGTGTVISLRAPGVQIKGFEIRNSGSSLDEENSGIAGEAPGLVIEDNHLSDVLFGIYLRKASNSQIRGNTIVGMTIDLPRRGDAIRVWYSNDVRIENNVVRSSRDVVLWYSERLLLSQNRITEGRYGMHFMYCDDAMIENNYLVDNSVGAFLMYSRRLHLKGNTIAFNHGPSGYGIGLKDMDDAVVEGNFFVQNRVGAFLDNSPREVDSRGVFQANLFAYNDIGVLILPSVRFNQFSANSFIDNLEQVNIAGGGALQENSWDVSGMGNYWSDYAGFDADGDGIGDVPYKAEKFFEALLDRYPALQLYAFSPVVQAIDFASKAIPLVKPKPKLSDTYPLMQPAIPMGMQPLARDQQGGILPFSLLFLLTGCLILLLGGFRSRGFVSASGGRSVSGQKQEKQVMMIEIRNLSKSFGKVTALRELDLQVSAGETIALWGPNGAGKTTALHCMLGLYPFSGSIQIGGYEIKKHSRGARRLIGFVPQAFTLYKDLTVRESLQFYARLKGVRPGQLSDDHGYLSLAGLDGQMDKRVSDLSGGMKKRLSLVIALLNDPPLLLLDEPTTNLDRQSRAEFLALLKALKDQGKTMVLSSHLIDEVTTLADRVLLLEEGRVIDRLAADKLSRFQEDHLHLYLLVAPEQTSQAAKILHEQGFITRRNGHGIQVAVHPSQKIEPIRLLLQSSVPVEDFEILKHES